MLLQSSNMVLCFVHLLSLILIQLVKAGQLERMLSGVLEQSENAMQVKNRHHFRSLEVMEE